ncbi:MAG: DUF2723 domain-containing protein [Bacteroidetes bacterium]|nr:DUF2723 domain-containing protein [Bacteroidota bacterium]
MQNYRFINNLCGWIIFAISAFVYISTIEPTGSFWDCGEFIASSFKLQVGHPPGAPLFMMMGRIMSLFAGDDLTKVSVMINIMSALMSAGTILFLFWTITILTKKIVAPSEASDAGSIIAIMGAGFVGALAYTFSDSFWFSAVEGEVYATSSFFTAIVFWAMFKWEAVAEEKHGNRWIILIAYLMGLSIGIHLLNLLTIPALAFIYYFRKNKPSTMGVIKTAVAGVAILGIVQYGIISGFVKLASKFELMFVNGFGLPFWSGFIFFFLLIIGGIVYGLNYTHKRNMPLWNLSLLCMVFILLGYSSYAMIVIRSNANPPMDENDPEHAFNLLGYINREQYGDRPLFYGQYYNARQTDLEEGAMQYTKGEDKYIETTRKVSPIYDPAYSTIFPRMYSAQESHIGAYKEWAGIKGDQKPTFAQNLKFFWNYQVIHMYWRYFMWNFAGRQNDIQGHGGILKGNWISGIKGIDEMRLGPQDQLANGMKDNKARNTFYFLPLILGIVGMIWHYRRDKHDAWTVMLLFFFTGLAIVLYLNQYPYQPRERDYAYAASFYTFAIWIGLGVAAIAEKLKQKKVPYAVAGALTSVACLVAVPGIMAKEGWDDHDRSHRLTSRDIAWNYLQSTAPNAIIFTNGDNDTFPLWYAQDVENVRTDVRVVNLSLLNTDWYIDQMKRKAYQSDAVPFSLTHDKYVQGTRDYVPFYDRSVPGYTNVKDVMNFISSENPDAKVRTQGGSELNYFPTKKFFIKVDKEAVLKNGVVKPEDADKIVDTIFWDVDRSYLMKADLMILDLIANNDWTRPIYFAVTVGGDSYLNLEPYFQLEGLAYRFVPIRTNPDASGQTGRVGVKQMYDNMMNKFLWGNMSREEVYLDQNNLNMTMNFRNNFSRLAEGLYAEGKLDSTLAVLDKMNQEIPDKTVPYNVMMLRPLEIYYNAAKGLQAPVIDPSGMMTSNTIALPEARKTHAMDMARSITVRMADIYENELNYYFSLKGTEYLKYVDREMNQAMAIFGELIRIAKANNQEDIVKQLEPRFKKLEERYTK